MSGRDEREGEAREREFFARKEKVRLERLRADARRPGGELLDEAMRLSAFATELRAGAARERE